ncbi:hypothetical protein PHMEG_00035354 [Phytophthora megakarya]|uniref:Uncharacterized protein n=1 Tax=Phytophthora megakarya TaxID=4795 RepID=A0A225URP4_9STRA|nr:hypothetical protein PHMEG_00035354 [Phytophthora megakarya]
MRSDEPYGAQAVGRPTEDLWVARVSIAPKKTITCNARVLDPKDQTNGTDGNGIPQGQTRVGPFDERVGRDSSVLQTLLCVLWIPRGKLPREVGYVRLDSSKYNEWQVLAYVEGLDETLL